MTKFVVVTLVGRGVFLECQSQSYRLIFHNFWVDDWCAPVNCVQPINDALQSAVFTVTQHYMLVMCAMLAGGNELPSQEHCWVEYW